MKTVRTTTAAAAVLLALGLGACSLTEMRPGGNMRSDDQFTYMSTPDLPVSVDLVDIRDNTIVWSLDVPLGQKLTIRFYEDGARDGDPNASDTMKWEVYDAQLQGTFLRNKIVVPPASARRLDVSYRETPEYYAEPGQIPPPPFDPLPPVPRDGEAGGQGASVVPTSPSSRSSMPEDAAARAVEVEVETIEPHQVEIVEP